MQARLDEPGWWARVLACNERDEGFTTKMLTGSSGAVTPLSTLRNRALCHYPTLSHARSAYLCMQAYFDTDAYLTDIGSAHSSVLRNLAAANKMVAPHSPPFPRLARQPARLTARG